MSNPIYKSYTFWALIAGLLAFVAKFFYSAFPLDEAQILATLLFILGLTGIVPAFRAGVRGVSLVNSLAFWELVAGLLAFAVHYFAPQFPFEAGSILVLITFILGSIGITPELKVRGLK